MTAFTAFHEPDLYDEDAGQPAYRRRRYLQMKNALALLLLVAFSNANSAELVCVGEQAASVGHTTRGKITSADSSRSNQSWIVSIAGVRTTGDHAYIFDKCDLSEDGWPSLCVSSHHVTLGFFYIDSNDVFTLTGVSRENGEFVNYIVKGKCRLL